MKQRFRFRFQARNLVLPGGKRQSGTTGDNVNNKRFVGAFSSHSAPDTVLELARRHSSNSLHSWYVQT